EYPKKPEDKHDNQSKDDGSRAIPAEGQAKWRDNCRHRLFRLRGTGGVEPRTISVAGKRTCSGSSPSSAINRLNIRQPTSAIWALGCAMTLIAGFSRLSASKSSMTSKAISSGMRRPTL